MTDKEKQINLQVIDIRVNLHNIMKDIESKELYNKLADIDNQIYKIREIVTQEEGVEEPPIKETKPIEFEEFKENSILEIIRAEVLEFIDDLDIAMEICDIFDRYEGGINDFEFFDKLAKYCSANAEILREVYNDSKNSNTYQFVEEALKLFKQESVLDKIKSEVESIDRYATNNGHDIWLRTPEEIKEEVFEIIDKYKVRSEDKND